ncbi:hypothetical protein RvY_04421 [Ramazzottius varieornatus]|uniref:Uncharacterized protein n=1 Tax=Ramazzottius varieornatus TaxID=947166 RepID=A0A1D1UV49_RAMVA|nr:hypothetical protein RvY_04421 [Ramazzottius varieornatus]
MKEVEEEVFRRLGYKSNLVPVQDTVMLLGYYSNMWKAAPLFHTPSQHCREKVEETLGQLSYLKLRGSTRTDTYPEPFAYFLVHFLYPYAREHRDLILQILHQDSSHFEQLIVVLVDYEKQAHLRERWSSEQLYEMYKTQLPPVLKKL